MEEKNLETRVFSATEIRLVKPESGPTQFEGYAAVFNRESEDLGGFRETIKPKAFSKAIKNSDTRALFNHDSNYVLGRSTSKTLELSEDKTGLKFKLVPPDTTWARDLMVSVDRGDITQCSFGFTLAKGGDEWMESTKGMRRNITQVDRLLDISLVTFPAYPDTSVALRNLEQVKKEEPDLIKLVDEMSTAFFKAEDPTEEKREQFCSILNDMQKRFGKPMQPELLAEDEVESDIEPMQEVADIKTEDCRNFFGKSEEEK